jgi:outer membrane biosynthesis protein TonB
MYSSRCNLMSAAFLLLTSTQVHGQESQTVYPPELLNKTEVRALHDSLEQSVAHPANLHGTTLIRVLVYANSSADIPQVLDTSGSLTLDSLAVELVKRMRFSKPHLGDYMPHIQIRIPIVFGKPKSE